MMMLQQLLLYTWLTTGCHSLLVSVQDTERYTLLFSSVILKCDYSTSAQLQDVSVTWRFKSFCKDPIFDYFSADYQASLKLNQDPSNDCNDNQREVRIIIQRRGQNEPVLGMEYRQRKITLRDKADLVISEVMWWDHGVYYCAVEAQGDTSGDPDKEVKLIVLPLARHRYMKQTAGQMPWMMDKPMYAGDDRNSHNSSYHLNPLLQRDFSLQNSLPMARQSLYPTANNKVLDFLESEIKNLNTAQPLRAGAHYSGGSHHPSMLSSLGDVGVREVERRVIQLPPIIEHIVNSQRTSNTSHQRINMGSWDPLESDRDRRRIRTVEDTHSTENDWRAQDRLRGDRANEYRRDAQSSSCPRRDRSPPRRYGRDGHSDESSYDDRRGRSNYRSERVRSPDSRRSPDRGEPRSGRRGSPDRSSRPRGHRRSNSPPYRRDSWSSEDENHRSRGRMERRQQSYDYPEEKPPSYKSLDVTTGKVQTQRAGTGRQSDRASSRSGRSMII
ncbi:hypothetical protein FKM82_008005 [Ascaphus truei]